MHLQDLYFFCAAALVMYSESVGHKANPDTKQTEQVGTFLI